MPSFFIMKNNKTDITEEIASRIRDLRMDLHMNQTEFAGFLGVSQAMVSRWESGDYNFSVLNLSRILKVLGCRLEIIENK